MYLLIYYHYHKLIYKNSKLVNTIPYLINFDKKSYELSLMEGNYSKKQKIRLTLFLKEKNNLIIIINHKIMKKAYFVKMKNDGGLKIIKI